MSDKNVEFAKGKIKKLDPELVRLALREKDFEKDEVEKAKEGIRQVYESISDTEKKPEILSRALAELSPEIIDKEVKKVKEILDDIDSDVLREAVKDLEIAVPVSGHCFACLNMICGTYLPCGYYAVSCRYFLCHRPLPI